VLQTDRRTDGRTTLTITIACSHIVAGQLMTLSQPTCDHDSPYGSIFQRSDDRKCLWLESVLENHESEERQVILQLLSDTHQTQSLHDHRKLFETQLRDAKMCTKIVRVPTTIARGQTGSTTKNPRIQHFQRCKHKAQRKTEKNTKLNEKHSFDIHENGAVLNILFGPNSVFVFGRIILHLCLTLRLLCLLEVFCAHFSGAVPNILFVFCSSRIVGRMLYSYSAE